MWDKKIIIIFLVCLILLFTSLNADTIEYSIVLDGLHKFSSGDDSAWASPYYDDSQWQSIMVPGSWQSQGIKPTGGLGWYRIHFTASDNIRHIDPALFIGRIGDVDEVFLNGVKIGGEGLIAESFVEATKVERLYRIPSNLIRYNADNVLSVRVMNTYLNGGIFDKNVSVGDYNFLLIEKFKRDKYVIVAEFCFFTFFALFFMTCLFFFLKGLRDKEYIYFWIFISLYGILFFLGSLTFYNTGSKSPFIQQLIHIISVLLPANLFLLFINVYREKINVYIKLILFSYLFIVFIFTLLPFFTVKQHFYIIWKVIFIMTAAFLFFYALKAYLRKMYESAPVLLGITGLITGFILESVGGLDLLQFTGFFLWDYSTVFFMICVMYALTGRYTRIKELQTASVTVFKAHEDERRRLSRELHDGIGTSLLALKLRLQMLEAKVKDGMPIENNTFPELISELTHSIDELRAVATDLRPAFLENTDIVDAIHWHAKKVEERLEIQINISVDNVIKIGSKTKDTIYRIYQEVISNAVKHSGATVIDVSLKMDRNFLSMEIKDNGKGFSSGHRKHRESGIGIYTIMERVELLDGIFKIKSSDKSGTSIFIEVPVE